MNKDIEVVHLGTEQEMKAYSKRMIVYAIVDGMEVDQGMLKKRKPLYLKQDHLEFHSPYYDHIQIQYKDIDRFVLKMATRYHLWGVFSEFRFYLDFDIYVKDQIHKFEVQNMKTSDDVIAFLKTIPIEIEDPIGTFDIFEKHPYLLERTRYLQANFKKIAKQYHLEYPRSGTGF
ncbi:MAG: hypothetical protein ACI4SR_10635 [Faecalibacillus sp.]